jgi:serine/threonine-protein kinase
VEEFGDGNLAPGVKLDRYELLCPLAQGGMALVWLARIDGLGYDKIVVIKTILPKYAQDVRFQNMFLDEARITTRIHHPNVAGILDVGEHNGTLYMAMEWVDGDSLSRLLNELDLRRARMPVGVALRICADLCAGLHAAHEVRDENGEPLGVVHRDVSPSNLLLCPSGEIKLIDFGVAKARDRYAQDTSAGQLKGKLRYMAPEQAKGGNVDRRADVWSVGALLYELLSGQAPYDGPHELAILHRLTSGEGPDPLHTAIPAAARAIVEHAMTPRVNDRFGSAAEMAAALEAAMVQIREVTSHSDVARFTDGLLGSRRESRKRSVDTAMRRAQSRSQGGAVGGMDLPPAMPVQEATATMVVASRPGIPSRPGTGSRPRTPSYGSNPMMEIEMAPGMPGMTSHATLGSAVLSGAPPGLGDDALRRRTNIMLAGLGAGVIIVFGAAAGMLAKGAASKRSTASTAQTVEAPPATATAPVATLAPTAVATPVAWPQGQPPVAITTAGVPQPGFPLVPAGTAPPTLLAVPSGTAVPLGTPTTLVAPAPVPAPPPMTAKPAPANPTPAPRPQATPKPTPPATPPAPPKPSGGKRNYGF